jgi:hypothetical protein
MLPTVINFDNDMGQFCVASPQGALRAGPADVLAQDRRRGEDHDRSFAMKMI